LTTLINQNDSFTNDMTIKGFNPLRHYRLIAQIEGYSALFLQKNQENAKRLVANAAYVRSFSEHPLLAILRDFLDRSNRSGQEVILLVYPYHADILEMIRILGLWPMFDNWKLSLTSLVAATGYPGKARFWDFSGYNEITTEAVPPPGDRRTEMHYYWEAGHFKPSLGDLMIARMLGNSLLPFGVELRPETVIGELDKARTSQLAYRVQRPSEVARIEAIISQAKARAQRSAERGS